MFLTAIRARSWPQGNLRDLCGRYLKKNYRVTIIDIQEESVNARKHNILVTPTLVWAQSQGIIKVVGALGDTGKMLQVLGVVEQRDTFDPKFSEDSSTPCQA